MTRKIDLTGRRFGRLVVIREFGRDALRQITWLCRCDCGTECAVSGGELRRKRLGRSSPGTRSCGCLRKDAPRLANTKHGGFGTRLYSVWASMKQRCYDKNCHAYRNYGARGIFVCDEWLHDFGAFESWSLSNGYAKGLTIDRVDNDSGYSPENCRWVDLYVQGANKRNNKLLTFRMETKPLTTWARDLGLNANTVAYRIANGWGVDAALTTPVRSGSRA